MTFILSDTQIANMAVSHAGGSRVIGDLASDKTNEAVQAQLWYDVVRTELLELFDWSFARKEVALNEHGDDEPTGWSFRYVAPADMVTPRFIAQDLWWEKDPIPFATLPSLDGSVDTINTDTEDACLIYTFDLMNPDRFSHTFAVAFSYLLASRFTFSTTGKQNLQKRNVDFYVQYLLQAMTIDWNRARRPKAREAEWMRDRAAQARSRAFAFAQTQTISGGGT